MSEVPFHSTRMGVKFFEADLPRLIEAVERLTMAVEKLAEDQKEDEDEGGSE